MTQLEHDLASKMLQFIIATEGPGPVLDVVIGAFRVSGENTTSPQLFNSIADDVFEIAKSVNQKRAR